MKRNISLFLVLSFLLTVFTIAPVSATTYNNEDLNFKAVVSEFYAPLSEENSNVFNVSDSQIGMQVKYLTTGSASYSFCNTEFIKLNGAHFKYTIDRETSGTPYVLIFINNSKDNNTSNQGISFKITNNNEAQFQIGINGTGDSNAINHSIYDNCYPNRTDRLYIPNYMSANINEYEMSFLFNANNGLDINFNGLNITVPNSVLDEVSIDWENVYIHFGTIHNGKPVYTLNSFHGGGENCDMLIKDINAYETDLSEEKNAIDLYLKAKTLSPEGKAKVKNYSTISSIVYGLGDEEYYKTTTADIGDYGWSGITKSQIDSGCDIVYTTKWGYVYTHWYKKPVVVNGLSLKYTLNGSSYYSRRIHMGLNNYSVSKSYNPTLANTAIDFRLENNYVFVFINGVRVNTADYVYGGKFWVNSSDESDVRISCSEVVNGDIDSYRFDFKAEANGGLTVYINDTKMITFSSEQVENSGIDLNNTYIKFSPDSYPSNQTEFLKYTVNYIRSGDAISMNAIDEERYYKVTSEDIYGLWKKPDVLREDTNIGHRITHTKTSVDYSYTHWTKESVDTDGLKFSYTLHGETIDSNIINIGLNDTAGNPSSDLGLSDTALNFKIEPEWVTVHINGENVVDYEYGAVQEKADSTYGIYCPDNINPELKTYDIKFAFEKTGGLSLYVNNIKLLTLSASDLTQAALDLNYTYLRFAPSNNNLDYTIHYIKSGKYTTVQHFEKPELVNGDANADTVFNIIDLVRMKKHIVDNNEPIFIQAANVVGEEENINAADLTAVRKMLMGSSNGVNQDTDNNALNSIDFVVDVEEAKEIVVLQLTDPQIIDSSQARTSERLNSTHKEYWAPENMESQCFSYMRKTIESTKPDLIIMTGDIVYGEFDDKGTSLLALIEFMDGFGIPWAPVFGNHENESKMGVDWQCEQLEKSEYCLFKQRTLTGNGNYTVGITQGGELKRVFFMLDSNGCAGISSESLANGHSTPIVGFGKDQIDWYTETAKKISKLSPDTKISFAFHIQPLMFKTAYSKYGFTNSDTEDNPINIDGLENAEDCDFGYIGRNLKSAWDKDLSVYYSMRVLGVDSIFVGHEHCNSASVVYEGVRFQYGLKASTYDRANYVKSDGTIEGSYYNVGTPMVGGTVMTLCDDGTINNAYIYYCEDFEIKEPEETVSVNGL